MPSGPALEKPGLVAAYNRIRIIGASGSTTLFIPSLANLFGSGNAARAPRPPIPWKPRTANASTFLSG